MKLYYFQVAPNPTRVRVYLAEKGIQVELVSINLVKGEQKTPEHFERNPLGNLPVLQAEDGSYLTESTAIIEYLEELYPEPPMIGTTPLDRAHVRRLDRIADLGVLCTIARIVHATKSPLGLPPAPEIAAQELKNLPAALKVLDESLSRNEFAAGPAPTIVDCTLCGGFGFARFAGLELPAFANLERWRKEFSQRPSVPNP